MLKFVNSFRCNGIDGTTVKVEVEVKPGLGIHMVGLADQVVKECLLRTVTALQSKGFRFPGKKITINLAPADLQKTGCGYDLPIALAFIAASEQCSLNNLERWMVRGELGLDGKVRSVPGCVVAVDKALRAPAESGKLMPIIIPLANAAEVKAAFATGVGVYAVEDLNEAISIIQGETHPDIWEDERVVLIDEQSPFPSAWDSILGNEGVRRALVIAAAGGHHLLLMGAPGSQKTTIARAYNELLPALTPQQALEVAKIYSIAGTTVPAPLSARPFRAPHSSCSLRSLLGGGPGDNVQPGDVSLAHNGTLFLDDVAEMPKSTLEALRGPLEDGKVFIRRLNGNFEFPAEFKLVAAMNPCPCGYYGEGDRCTCTPGQRKAYLSRLYGPVYDAIDVQAWTHPFNGVEPQDKMSLKEARALVSRAIFLQWRRYNRSPISRNGDLKSADIERFCPLSEECRDLVERLTLQLGLNARSYTRLVKVARTIADLEGETDIHPFHLSEAASYRFLDRTNL